MTSSFKLDRGWTKPWAYPPDGFGKTLTYPWCCVYSNFANQELSAEWDWYISSNNFKVESSHLVKGMAGSANVTSGSNPTSGNDCADRVQDVYKDWKCPLRAIIFRMAAGDMLPNHAQQVFERFGYRDAIHRYVQSFIMEASAIRSFVPQKDLVLEKITDLIKQFCAPLRKRLKVLPDRCRTTSR
ncbi:hypothetical protein BJY52DRAFT_1230371 [Lactarius psammicola]|nr:hypothetical protein BJY52DRAFT_1230371 [Lactarius psammicola]